MATAKAVADQATEQRDLVQKEMNKLKALSDAENVAFENEWKQVAEVCVAALPLLLSCMCSRCRVCAR